jgi:hypothetical protein
MRILLVSYINSTNQNHPFNKKSLRSKLKDLLEKFDVQQAYYDNSVKTKDLEAKLLEAKLAQQVAINNAEKEKYKALLHHGVAQEVRHF